MSLKKLFILAGIFGPAFYFLLITVLGLLWQGYNPIHNYMSELGGVDSPYRAVMNVFGFQLLGLLIILFSFTFNYQVKRSWLSKIVSILLIIGGVFMILVGFFPCDPGCRNYSPVGRLHVLTSIPQSIVWPLAAIFSSFVFAGDKRWGKKWSIISLILGIVSLSTGPLLNLPAIQIYIGLMQRLGMGISLFWIFLVATKMFLINSRAPRILP